MFVCVLRETVGLPASVPVDAVRDAVGASRFIASRKILKFGDVDLDGILRCVVADIIVPWKLVALDCLRLCRKPVTVVYSLHVNIAGPAYVV